jgi:hypothetical protein
VGRAREARQLQVARRRGYDSLFDGGEQALADQGLLRGRLCAKARGEVRHACPRLAAERFSSTCVDLQRRYSTMLICLPN